MAILLQSLLYLTQLPTSTRLIIPVNLFWTFWVFYELVDAYLIKKNTMVGTLNFVTILPGSVLAWMLLSASALIRRQNSRFSFVLMLLFPVVIFLSVMLTSAIDPDSNLGISQMDFTTPGSIGGSFILSAVLFVPYLVLGAVPFGVAWFIWILNLVDSTYFFLKVRNFKRP